MTGSLIILIILGFFILLNIISNIKNNKRLKKMINDAWGKIPEQTINERELGSISSYFENLQNIQSKKMYIDDITWNDLDLDKVFGIINNTHTTLGEEYLYNLIRCPVFNESEFQDRSKLINFFKKDKNNRQKVQLLLAKLGKIRHINVSDYFYCMDNIRYKNKKFYFVLALLLYISTILIFFDVRIGAIAVALSIITNATVYYKVKNTIEYKQMPLSYIIKMISTANAITKLKIPEISQYQRKLKESVVKVKKINNKAYYLLHKAQDPITEYIKTLLLAELIAFESCHNFVITNRDEIRNIFEILGYIDSLISVASFREYVNFYCEPYFIKNDSNGIMTVKANDLYHPLIKNPKTYSFSFNKPVLITGSNASGKSTFLKSVAINAVLAQTIFTCLAREFYLSQFMIYTSMALKDNLLDGESYFIVELKSLKRIIDIINSGMPCLCIVDEVLRGTNTVERIAASSEVLYSLKNKNCISIAATHDIELTTILEGIYENYHFREEVTEDNNVLFNYTLYSGKSSTKNALKLLKIIGYNNMIVKRAQERSDKFVMEGVWEKANIVL